MAQCTSFWQKYVVQDQYPIQLNKSRNFYAQRTNEKSKKEFIHEKHKPRHNNAEELTSDNRFTSIIVQARTKGGGVRLVRTNLPPSRDHAGPLGPFFLYVFRKLDCHNVSLLFKLREI